MSKPRLIYYNDAHHFHAKRIEPPASIHKLQWPVDEVAGTGVDLLALGLGYGDVYFHNSKVGRTVGQLKDVWEDFIDWRIMRMVQEARRLGTDQVREVIKRGRQTGLAVFPSLKLQDGALPGGERCGLLKWEHGAEVCIGGPEGSRERWSYDFTNELVRQDKLAVIREMLDEYGADGIELDFLFGGVYFRRDKVEENIPTMTRFVAQVREMANEIGEKQCRQIPIMARVPHRKEIALDRRLDPETWLKEGSIDLVVGQVPGSCMETGTVDGRWLADAANRVGAAAYLRPARRVYDERTIRPSVEMIRALGQSLRWQGFAGMYLGYLPWPFSDAEYRVLREAAYPEVVARRDKRYILAPREGVEGGETTTPDRKLPYVLEEGETASVDILVADDVGRAKQDGEMREPILTVRFSNFCIEDHFEIRFNGQMLPVEEAEITDERAMRILATFPGPVEAPMSMAAHWFRYKLPINLVRQGQNNLEVTILKKSQVAGFARAINGVEVQTRYKDFERPQGLEVDRVAPIG